MFLFILREGQREREREREHMSGGEERGRERIPSRLCTVSASPSWNSNPQSMRLIMT